MGALERLAEAQISSNLADDSLKLSDVDYLPRFWMGGADQP